MHHFKYLAVGLSVATLIPLGMQTPSMDHKDYILLGCALVFAILSLGNKESPR